MLLVYTHKVTPRLTYIFKQIFVRILKIPISFTTKVDEFVAHSGPKITYSKAPLGKEFFIRNHALLFEQGIANQQGEIQDWDDIPCFFPLGEQSSIPYDIFAASFYLITRYEEYQPHVTDKHERFSATQSLAFKGKFLEKPVIDIWVYRLLDKLKQKFPDYEFPTRNFQHISSIDVKEAYAFKHKGFIRNFGGAFRDLFQMEFKRFIRRMAVIFRLRKDPYENFDLLLQLGKKYNIDTKFFFLFSEYTTFDPNVSYTNKSYKLLIKSVIDYAAFGQLFSYYTMKNIKKLKREKNRFEEVVIRPLTKSRQHMNRMELPKTYQNLIDNDIVEEYSMGYHTHTGFRAGTCTPFYFYDLDYEIQTPLKVFPYAFNAEIYKNQQLTPKEALLHMLNLKNEVKKVNGTFISLFHNSILSDLPDNQAWLKIYEDILKPI